MPLDLCPSKNFLRDWTWKRNYFKFVVFKIPLTGDSETELDQDTLNEFIREIQEWKLEQDTNEEEVDDELNEEE